MTIGHLACSACYGEMEAASTGEFRRGRAERGGAGPDSVPSVGVGCGGAGLGCFGSWQEGGELQRVIT